MVWLQNKQNLNAAHGSVIEAYRHFGVTNRIRIHDRRVKPSKQQLCLLLTSHIPRPWRCRQYALQETSTKMHGANILDGSIIILNSFHHIDLKGFWRWCLLYRIHRIFLDFFHRPVFQKTRRFGNWIWFRPQVKVGEKKPTQLGPLQRANLNHWTWVIEISSL
jgi:hypothetical protein